jgi:transposase InsO family protein
MSRRLEFVLLAQQSGVDLSALCRRFGISAKTGWKWRKRFAEAGATGLANRSRRPHCSPDQTPEKVAKKVLAVLDNNPTWGGRKLRERLLYVGEDNVPAASTCTEIIRRAGRLSPEPSARGPLQRFERGLPNELWQIDHKGHFATQCGRRCHALTAIDDHSRFNLILAASANERGATVQQHLTAAFTLYGLPEALLCDNGPPWGHGDPTCPYTTLTVWLLRLGVHVLHGRPYHPQTQGKEERFHRTLSRDLISRHTWRDLNHCQEAFDHYRQLYNCERPHHSLTGVPPITRYRPSPRGLPETLPPIEYPADAIVRIVPSSGYLVFQNQTWYIGQPFAGCPIALRTDHIRDGLWNVSFASTQLGQMDFTAPLQPKRSARPIYPPSEAGKSDLLPSFLSDQSG